MSDMATGNGDWSAVIDELRRIRTLDDDWDGEGTEAPDEAVVDRAITLAQALQASGVMPPGRVHASVNATVNFEWRTPLVYIEIEVASAVDVECRAVRPQQGVLFTLRVDDVSKDAQLAAWVLDVLTATRRKAGE